MRRITGSFLRRPKSPWGALVVSLVIPGGGQIYNRELIKGLLLFLIAVGFLLWTVSNVLTHRAVYRQMLDQTDLPDIAAAHARARMPHPYAPLLFYLLVALYSAFDGYGVAKQILDLLAGERTTLPPERCGPPLDPPKEGGP